MFLIIYFATTNITTLKDSSQLAVFKGNSRILLNILKLKFNKMPPEQHKQAKKSIKRSNQH
jgi:hypothetical protein